MNNIDNTFGFQEKVLSMRGYRQQLLASNIANADTPNYKAMDIDFTRDLLKQMATSFVERLAEMTESTGEFHKKIESYQEQITSTEDIGELNVILDNLMQDTKAMQLDALRTHEQLQQSQVEVQEAEQRILQLTAELHQVSEVAHNDYLTNTLNRRGMEEAFEREFSRAERTGAPISVSLLDIDRFKKLNDALGHEAGDMALVHLAKVVKSALRPTDVLARYGGEEFIIILPETDQAEGIVVMTRVQRELTKSFFLHDNKKVLITFSAGVAQRSLQESPEEVIKRADDALYNAKHAGRNRVFGALNHNKTVVSLQPINARHHRVLAGR